MAGLPNKLTQRLLARSLTTPETPSIGKGNFLLVNPDFAEFKGSLSELPDTLRQALDQGERLYIKNNSPISTFGKHVYVLWQEAGELQLKLPSEDKRWKGEEVSKALGEILKRIPTDDPEMPKEYGQKWIVERDYSPARLEDRVVEVRTYIVPSRDQNDKTGVFATVGYVGAADTRQLHAPTADWRRPEEEIIRDLYQSKEYGGHSQAVAAKLAREWLDAAREMALRIGAHMNDSVQEKIGVPLAACAIAEALEKNTPILGQLKTQFLNYGFAVDLSPVWNKSSKRFDMAFVELQIWPGGLPGLFERMPGKKDELLDLFAKTRGRFEGKNLSTAL